VGLRSIRLGALGRRRVVVAVLDLVLLGLFFLRRRRLCQRLARALPEVTLLEAVRVRESSFGDERLLSFILIASTSLAALDESMLVLILVEDCASSRGAALARC